MRFRFLCLSGENHVSTSSRLSNNRKLMQILSCLYSSHLTQWCFYLCLSGLFLFEHCPPSCLLHSPVMMVFFPEIGWLCFTCYWNLPSYSWPCRDYVLIMQGLLWSLFFKGRSSSLGFFMERNWSIEKI